MKTTRLTKPDSCPVCAYRLDAVTPSPDNADATPEPGDFTVCLKCASLLVFGEGLKVRRPTAVEQDEARASPRTVRLVAAIASMKGKV